MCFNAERYIERAIKSVLGQSYADVEYIVVDGASEDATLMILDRYRDRIDRVVSEKDEGIYDAMNKGIRLATGDLLFFLNSDDFFVHPDALKLAVASIGNQEADIYYGDLLILDDSGKVRCEEHGDIDRFGIFAKFPTMPSLLYRKSVFDRVGVFSTEYRIVSDYYWIVSAFIVHNIKAVYIGVALVFFQIGGISTDSGFRSLQKSEKRRVRETFFDRRDWALYKKIVKRRRRWGFFGSLLERLGSKFIFLKRGAFDCS